MYSRPVKLALAIMTVIGIWPLPLFPIDDLYLATDWDLTPGVTRAHPKKQQVAIVVTESAEIVSCEIWYSLERDYTDLAPPALEVGGKVVAQLKIVKASGKLKIGKQVQKVEAIRNTNLRVVLGWSDKSGPVSDRGLSYSHNKLTSKFPTRVDPGDVILWTLKFRGMPELRQDLSDHPPFRDHIWSWARCWSCGTVEYACPVDW